MPDRQRASDLGAVHATSRHDEHRPDQPRPVLPVVVDEGLDVIRIQDVGVDHVAGIDVVDDLEVGRLHGFVSRGDGSFQVGVLAHRGAGLHDQLGRGLELRRRRLAARRNPTRRLRLP